MNTPGDLSARHVEVLRHLLDCHGNHTVIDDDDASALTEAIAALSALPAAGGVRPYFKDEAALIQFLDSLCELDGEGGDGQFKWKPAQRAIAGIKATTPQPSAAVLEDGGPPCSTHPDAPHGFNRNASHTEDRYVCDCEGWKPDAAVGAQAEDELLAAFVLAHDDEEAWLEGTGHLYDPHLPTRAGIRAVQAALTRQPVAGDGDADFELWQDGEFVAGSSGPRAEAWREILHYAAQYEQDGAVTIMEVIRRPLAAPAATPTDGGEGS